MATNTCSGCRTHIADNNYLTCSTCECLYDLLCANISQKVFEAFSTERRTTWICIECRSKLPKSDNTHTPVRGNKNVSAANNEGYENVTVRDKTKRDQCLQPLQQPTDYSASELRTLIREELERYELNTIEERLRSAISKTVAEQLYPALTNNHKALMDNISGLYDRVAAIEEKLNRATAGGLKPSIDTFKHIDPATERASMGTANAAPPIVVVQKRVTREPAASTTLENTSSRLSPAAIPATSAIGTDVCSVTSIGTSLAPLKVDQTSRSTKRLPALQKPPKIKSQEKVVKIMPASSQQLSSPKSALALPNTPSSVNKVSLPVPGSEDIDDSLEDSWTEVKRRQSRVSTSNVSRGTAAPGSTILEASERIQYLHLFYVKQGTTETMVLDHLKTICGSDPCIVQPLKSRGNYASFKLSVPLKWSESILSPRNWAQDICIKPWKQLFRGKGEWKQAAGQS